MKDMAEAQPTHKREGGRKAKELLRRWWPAIMVSLGGMALSSVYYITAVQAFKAGLVQPGFVYLSGGLTLSLLPGAAMWLVMRCIR